MLVFGGVGHLEGVPQPFLGDLLTIHHLQVLGWSSKWGDYVWPVEKGINIINGNKPWHSMKYCLVIIPRKNWVVNPLYVPTNQGEMITAHLRKL